MIKYSENSGQPEIGFGPLNRTATTSRSVSKRLVFLLGPIYEQNTSRIDFWTIFIESLLQNKGNLLTEFH